MALENLKGNIISMVKELSEDETVKVAEFITEMDSLKKGSVDQNAPDRI